MNHRDADESSEIAAAALPAPASARDRLAVIEQELVPDEHYEHLPRTLKSKLFGIGFSGWFQLIVICIIVGAIFQAGGIDFFAPDFSFTGIAGAVTTGAFNLLGWAMEVGWRPLITGALVVIPLWLAWRLLSVPFRN